MITLPLLRMRARGNNYYIVRFSGFSLSELRLDLAPGLGRIRYLMLSFFNYALRNTCAVFRYETSQQDGLPHLSSLLLHHMSHNR